ncbi:hypothetical protein [Ramlibacter montanisoli]|uniref:hypothetical protein n=1 Tax=Ramlibacter montanisoli TaxID=2732512 RepID=UPI00209C29B4|nr:hypothetical protein [Ramlibacter montanisoli]
MHALELPHLAVRSPAQVAVARLQQVHLRLVSEALRGVERGGKLVRECLDVGEAAGAGRPDRAFVQPHRLQFLAREARDLRADQRRAALDVVGAVRGPLQQLAMVRGGLGQVRCALVGRRRVAAGEVGEGAEEPVLHRLGGAQVQRQQLPQPGDRQEPRGMVAGEVACLQLGGPVHELHHPGPAGVTALHLRLVEVRVVQAAEARRQPAQHARQCHVGAQQVGEGLELHRPPEHHAFLGLALDDGERVARGEPVGAHALGADRGVVQVAAVARIAEGDVDQVASGAVVPRPGHHHVAQEEVDHRTEAGQSAPVHQVAPELPEVMRAAVVAEQAAGDDAEAHVEGGRGIAVAAGQDQPHRAAHQQREQRHVDEERRHGELAQHVQGGHRVRIRHQRQFQQFVARARGQQRARALVLAAHVLVGRVLGPLHPEFAQEGQAARDRALALVQRRVHVDLQARDPRAIGSAAGAFGDRGQQVFRLAGCVGEEGAFRALQLQPEGQRGAVLPAALVQQRGPGGEVAARGSIGRGRLGAFGRQQVQLRHPFALVARDDQVGAAVELVHDVEDDLGALRRGCVRGEHAADAQVLFRPLVLRDQRIGGFLHAVVVEGVGRVGAHDQPGAHGLPQLRMHLLDRRFADGRQQVEARAVADACQQLQRAQR